MDLTRRPSSLDDKLVSLVSPPGPAMFRSATSPQLVLVPRMTQICKECGCVCSSCLNNSLDLHQEIEDLRAKLLKSSEQLVQMEQEFSESNSYSEVEIGKLQDELSKLRDRYDRLYESHKKLQKINHNLEDKLLTVVQKYEEEKAALDAQVQEVKNNLLDSKVTICQLEDDCDRYRDDCNTAAQLLQCKPSNFVAHKLDALPLDLQQRLRGHLSKEQQLALEGPPPDDEPKMIKVAMPTFPPTAMVYSVNKPNPPHPPPPKIDTVPMSLIAKVLTEAPVSKYRPQRLYICTKCKTDYLNKDKETQTCSALDNGFRTAVANMRTNPPTIMPHYPGVHKPRTNSTETEIM